ncbi:MAG: Stp1/IreP family PP2C-type Ser/Thr phosphatase [Bdellovibrionota bacterium]
MKPKISCVTDKGLRRESNQDSFLVNQDLGLYIVADGMGGHQGGEVASALAVKTIEEVIERNRNSLTDPKRILKEAYQEASRRIYDLATTQQTELLGMGTTMVLAYVVGPTIFIANVGDSRCYLFSEKQIWQITEDHSLINEQIRGLGLTMDQAKAMVGRNVITRSVGYERQVEPDVFEREIVEGESYLLCSDGLTSLVSDREINEIFLNGEREKISDLCVEEALNKGGDDNVTVMLINFGD